MSCELQDKIVLVTGGSRGIGTSIVRYLARAGARVLLHYGRGEAEAEAIVDEISARRCGLIRADLSERDLARDLWRRALGWRGRIDVDVLASTMPQPSRR